MKRFVDVGGDSLDDVIKALQDGVTEPVVNEVTSLVGEEARLRLAFQAGRFSILTDLVAARKQQQKGV